MQLKKIQAILVLSSILLAVITFIIAFLGYKETAGNLVTVGAFFVIAAFLNGYYILKRGFIKARKQRQEGKPILTKSLLDDDDS